MRRLPGLVAAAAAALAATLTPGPALPSAAAAPCSDVEVIWARGTVGNANTQLGGQGFIDLVRAKAGGRSVSDYIVNYPASFDFATSAPAGAADATAHVQWMADNCPDTKLVLSGLSQGAGVISLITANPGPLGKYTATPMPPQLADHVAAVAVFGNPIRKFQPGGGPLNQISALYGAKTIDLCADNDVFCSRGLNLAAHFSYLENGMYDQAAQFVADRLQ
jgi:cutinase